MLHTILHAALICWPVLMFIPAILIFCDGFDNYSTITDLWEFNGQDCSIRLNTGQARTGIGCLQINSAAFGPTKTFNQTTNLLVCTNWNSNTGGQVLRFMNFLADIGNNATVILLQVNLDGSVSVIQGPSNGNVVLGTSAANLYHFNTYNNLAMRATCSPTNGTVDVWVNGAHVLALTGVNTAHNNQGAPNTYDGCQLMAPGGIPTCFHDDVYMYDCSSGGSHTTFEGALRIYTIAPTANAVPVDWTPLAPNTNWQNVSEIPPDGDTSYNSSSTVGQEDQYVYPAASIPANSSVLFVQHEMDLRIDTAGSRSVASVINGGAPANSQALTSNYHIYPTEYDSLGLADFPLDAGPRVTL